MRQSDALKQRSIRNQSNHPVYYIESVTETAQTISDFHDLRSELGLQGNYCILTRTNESVKRLRDIDVTEVWTSLNEIDSERERLLKSIFTAYLLAKDGRIELAVKEIIRSLRTDENSMLKSPFQGEQFIDSLSKRSLAVDLLELLMTEIDESANCTTIEFYQQLHDFLIEKGYNIKKITRGNIKAFSEQTEIQELIKNLFLPEEKNTEIRTIHKAKGAEYESVLLYLDDIKELESIIYPDIDSEDDDTRIYYVALSRARDLLCIAGPPLKDDQKNKLTELNIIKGIKKVHIN